MCKCCVSVSYVAFHPIGKNNQVLARGLAPEAAGLHQVQQSVHGKGMYAVPSTAVGAEVRQG